MTDNKGLGSTRPVLCVAPRDSPAFGSGRSSTELYASSREIRMASGVRACRSSFASSGECLRRRSPTRVLGRYCRSRLADQLHARRCRRDSTHRGPRAASTAMAGTDRRAPADPVPIGR